MAGKRRMPAAQLRSQLARFATFTEQRRDEDNAMAETNKSSEYLYGFYRGRASAHALALASLYVWTGGEFGELLPGETS
ncbi:hypothetical protein ACWEOE_31825 [Amycolatopsis sp. NPDC004368]